MEEKHPSRFDWRQVLSVLALGIGVIGIINAPATAAAIQEEDNIKVAQVGIRSRINAPTPLNLRPRTHIPLPSRSYRRYDRGYGYYRHHDHSGHHHHRDRYDRHYRHNTYRRRRSNRGKIIINPGSLSDYGSRNYIRIIGK